MGETKYTLTALPAMDEVQLRAFLEGGAAAGLTWLLEGALGDECEARRSAAVWLTIDLRTLLVAALRLGDGVELVPDDPGHLEDRGDRVTDLTHLLELRPESFHHRRPVMVDAGISGADQAEEVRAAHAAIATRLRHEIARLREVA